jgi:hypothetical protein
MDEDYVPDNESEDEEEGRVVKKRKVYPAALKAAVWNALELAKVDDEYPRGTIVNIAKQFGVNRRMVENTIEKGLVGAVAGDVNFSDNRKYIGPDLKYNPEQLKTQLSELPIELRGTVRDAAHGLHMPWSTFFKYTKKHGVFHSVTVALKPKLTPTHKQNRLAFARSKIDVVGNNYSPQYNVIHIDEKNFHVDKKTRRVFIGEGEDLPYRSHRNANYIQKVMFLAAVGRPRFRDPPNREDPFSWDGKIGLYPLVEEHFARRGDGRTGLRQGDRILTPVSITTLYFESIILDKLLPDIVFKCPAEMLAAPIIIQLDNATPHNINLGRFNARCTELGVDCRLQFQPAQSPDFNICDLSFFPAIQALYYKISGVNNVISCVDAVAQAFAQFDPNNLNRAYLSLFMNYNCVLQHEGGNKYAVPHMGKERLERLGTLPVTIAVEDFVVPEEVIEENEDNIMEQALIDDNFDGVFDWEDEDNVGNDLE